MFLNHSKSLQDAGAFDDQFDFIVTVGHPMDWHWGKLVNTGHFLAKSTPWTRRFLDEMWSLLPGAGKSCPSRIYPLMNGWLDGCSGDGTGMSFWLGDQGVFHATARSSLIPTDHLCHIKWVNMRDMNSEVPWYDDGDLVVHLPGRGNSERHKVFEAFNQRTDFDTGVVKDKSGVLQNDLHDWRVKRGLFRDYVGAGWNIPCVDLYRSPFH
jgi:hypothetical protein